jgi:NAD(P)-dependent dehydrogenase (short-subunit alcohol dehydrogenase family)
MSTSTTHLPLAGKTAIVAGGIGAGIAYELGKRGADVRFCFLHSAAMKLIYNPI